MEKEKEDKDPPAGSSGIQTLDSLQAMCLPLGASISLLVMFFFFDSMQMLFASCTAVIATVALAFLLLPMCQYLMRLVLGGGGDGITSRVLTTTRICLDQAMRQEPQDLPGHLRSLHLRRAPQCQHLRHGRLHMDHDRYKFEIRSLMRDLCKKKREKSTFASRSLVTNGCAGDGLVRGLHSFCPAAQPQGVYAAFVGSPPLRRLLGLLLAVRLQRQRHGQGQQQQRLELVRK